MNLEAAKAAIALMCYWRAKEMVASKRSVASSSVPLESVQKCHNSDRSAEMGAFTDIALHRQRSNCMSTGLRF